MRGKIARAGTARLFYRSRGKGNVLVDEEKGSKRLPRKLLYSTAFPFLHHTSPGGTEEEKKEDGNETGKHFIISEPEDLLGSSPPGLRAMLSQVHTASGLHGKGQGAQPLP